MNRVKPGDIVNVRVLSVDEKRGRIGFSMKPEAAPRAKLVAAAQAADGEQKDNHRGARSGKPAARSGQNRGTGADNRGGARREQSRGKDKPRNTRTDNKAAPAKPAKDDNKIGTLGALLKEAGLKK
jgi:uncharacterized protein